MSEALEVLAAERSSTDPAHDLAHVKRVAKSAQAIATAERADEEICVSASLLHELFSYPKNHPDSPRSGEVCAEHARVALRAQGMRAERIEPICYAIAVHPFSRGIVPETLEAKILQDADRLDAIGAIGIARCFATAGRLGHAFYSSEDAFCDTRAPTHYAVDHFYAKLLRLPDTLHTQTARAIAADRLRFMRAFLAQLAREI
jgi:uncharacterized protein